MKAVEVFFTPAAGKKLIAQALASRADVQAAVREHTVVVIKGTTNAWLAEVLLAQIGETGFEPRGFYRGVVKPAALRPGAEQLNEDVIITGGKWIRGKTIFDAETTLTKDDIIFKGANAVNLRDGTAGILIGNTGHGTIVPISAAVMSKRVRFIVPVGVEKRVDEPITALCALCNDGETAGWRMFPAVGEVYTELDALRELCGADVHLLSGGGVGGCEGGCWFLCTGAPAQLQKCIQTANDLADTPLYTV